MVAIILAKNELVYSSTGGALHDEVAKVCVNDAGGGWLKVTSGEPSFTLTR